MRSSSRSAWRTKYELLRSTGEVGEILLATAGREYLIIALVLFGEVDGLHGLSRSARCRARHGGVDRKGLALELYRRFAEARGQRISHRGGPGDSLRSNARLVSGRGRCRESGHPDGAADQPDRLDSGIDH